MRGFAPTTSAFGSCRIFCRMFRSGLAAGV